ncbi:hypothetical protein B9Z51_00625 [Limnohabitans sp. T6-5]|nr:hypothetical protein B9Z51_00625 [Limnohabitans sp. T6-5]
MEKTLSNPVTVQELKALTADQQGRRFAVGQSTYCTVHQATDKSITVRFEWRFKSAGKVRTMHLGTWPAQSLKALNDKRADMQTLLKDGIDPIAKAHQDREKANEARELERAKHAVEMAQAESERLQALADQERQLKELEALNARMTVRGLFDFWQSTDLKKRQDAGAEALRAFERDVFPIMGDLAIEAVTKAHIQRIIDTMLNRGVKRMTERTFSDLRQLFGFALDRDLIDADPTARIKKHKIGGNTERDRVLSEPELIAFFRLLPSSGLAETSQCALLIQLATAGRIGEVLGARWDHVDFERRTWTLPETKNGKRHMVSLSDTAIKQFKRLHALTGLTPWAFPASRLNGPVCSKTVSKQVTDRQRGDGEPMSGRTKQINALALAGGKWTPHDLRRTAATLMAELGVLPEVIERCLNHTEQVKVKRIYQRAQYEAPMREAWQRLGDRLALLADKPGNVVTLARAA